MPYAKYVKLIPARILVYAIVATLWMAVPAMADLRAAKSFVVLSAGDRVTFRERDKVDKAVIPDAVTCAAGVGCSVSVGGKRVSLGHNNQINAVATTMLGEAGPDARAYAASLASLPATQTIPAIALNSGASTTITAEAGLNIISVPSIVAGNTKKRDPYQCMAEPSAHGDRGATITISGSSAATAIVNVGTSTAPGVLLLCGGSKILLTGGITADKVVFNVAAPGKPVVLAEHTIVNGTILAMERPVRVRGDARERTVINGAVLAGGKIEIGSYVDINFYPPSQFGTPVTVTVKGTVDVQKLPPPASQPMMGEADEFLPAPRIDEPPGQPTPSKATTDLSLTTEKQIDVVPGGPEPQDPTLRMPINFRGLNENGPVPSDTQLAAGQTRLLQMTNRTGAFFSKLAGNQLKNFDLAPLFLGIPLTGGDPRVLFDASTNTYFAVYELITAGGDDIRLGVAPEPGDQWTIYSVRSNTANFLFDQPKLGVSLNKVILSWNDYDKSVTPRKFRGADYLVMQKSALVSRAAAVPAVFWGPDSSRFQIVPVQSLSADAGNHFASYLNVDSKGNANIHLMTFTGEPGVSTVDFKDDSFALSTVTQPPLASQPSGGDATVATNDTRLLSTTWQNNHLWAVFNEGCTPAGDSALRACERFIQFRTDKPGITQNFQLGASGQDLYFGAVTLNSNDDLFFGITTSSTSQNPAAAVMGVPGGIFGPVTGGIIHQSGTQPYVCSGGTGCPRWGDYSGATRDPNDPTMGWVVQQFGGLANPAGAWGTGIAAVFFAPTPVCQQNCQKENQVRELACKKDRDDCMQAKPKTTAACVSEFRLCMDASARELKKCIAKCTTPPPPPPPPGGGGGGGGTPPPPPTKQACLQSCKNANQAEEASCKKDRDDCMKSKPKTSAACTTELRLCMDAAARDLKKCKAKCK